MGLAFAYQSIASFPWAASTKKDSNDSESESPASHSPTSVQFLHRCELCCILIAQRVNSSRRQISDSPTFCFCNSWSVARTSLRRLSQSVYNGMSSGLQFNWSAVEEGQKWWTVYYLFRNSASNFSSSFGMAFEWFSLTQKADSNSLGKAGKNYARQICESF